MSSAPKARHRHAWTGLWGRLGQFAEAPWLHMHSCFDCDDAILVGKGESCSGKRADHKVRR